MRLLGKLPFWREKDRKFASLEEAVNAINTGSGGNQPVACRLTPGDSCNGRLSLRAGRVYLHVNVRVDIVSWPAEDLSKIITPSGSYYDIEGIFDMGATVTVKLAKTVGYITGGKDVFRSLRSKTGVADWRDFITAQCSLFFYEQMGQIMPEELRSQLHDKSEDIEQQKRILERYGDRYIPV